MGASPRPDASGRKRVVGDTLGSHGERASEGTPHSEGRRPSPAPGHVTGNQDNARRGGLKDSSSEKVPLGRVCTQCAPRAGSVEARLLSDMRYSASHAWHRRRRRRPLKLGVFLGVAWMFPGDRFPHSHLLVLTCGIGIGIGSTSLFINQEECTSGF